MTGTQRILGKAMAAGLDAVCGVLIATALCWALKVPITLVGFAGVLVLAVVLSLAPDISKVIVVRLDPKATHHRQYTHFPIPILLWSFVIGFICGELFSVTYAYLFGLLASLCLFLHFVDDTCDPGGLNWLAPFGKGNIRLIAPETEPLSEEAWLQKYYLRWSHKTIAVAILGPLAMLCAGLYAWQKFSD